MDSGIYASAHLCSWSQKCAHTNSIGLFCFDVVLTPPPQCARGPAQNEAKGPIMTGGRLWRGVNST